MGTLMCKCVVIIVLASMGLATTTTCGADMEVGFARVNITPPMGIRMRGHPFNFFAKGVESHLYANAMCIGDGSTKVMVVSCDVAGVSNEMSARVCRKIEQDLGIPEGNVIVSATHTHSGPQTSAGRRGNTLGNDLISGYAEKLENNIVAALKQAHSNMQKGKLTVAYGELPGIGFNRRFIMSNRSIQTHPLTLDPHIVGPEGPDAKDLFVFCGYDEDGKVLGTAINFSCHATVMERRNEYISADFPGKTCDFVNDQLGGGALTLYLQGTCGNICQVNPLDGTHKEVGLEWTKVMGRKIGSKALELIENDAFEASGPLRTISREIELSLRQVDPVLAAWALHYKEVPEGNPVLSDYGAEKIDEIELPMMGLTNLFETPWWANRYARTVRRYAQNNARTAHVTVKVFAQDNWALVSLPGEFFMEFGDAIHERSPFETTIVAGYANGANGYIPTRKAFSRGGGYETNIGTARFTPDAGYLVVDAVVEMLQALRDK